MVVDVLMGIAILWILEEIEGDRVKYAFLEKKNDGISVNNVNFRDERDKSKFKKNMS